MNLFSLEKRRLRGDMIELFKIFRGFSRINFDEMFELDINSKTRGHTLKLKHKNRFYTDLGKFFFSNRVVDKWNELPASVVQSLSVESFKSKLDKYHFLKEIV